MKSAKKKIEEDKFSKLILETLEPHFENVKVYRYNSVSVRIRIIDPKFADLSLVDREKLVKPHLKGLSKEVRSDITVLLLLTDDELSSSLMNYEFDHPSHSTL